MMILELKVWTEVLIYMCWTKKLGFKDRIESVVLSRVIGA